MDEFLVVSGLRPTGESSTCEGQTERLMGVGTAVQAVKLVVDVVYARTGDSHAQGGD